MVGEGRAIGTKEGGVQSLRGAAGLSSDCTSRPATSTTTVP